ncbi:hypothetical protein QRX60_11635 [Amycolatopsis mongoliensis]|uniref:Uncharacterized protein n=1 Tax=Amycolatopsis mongoliensis TaxID=715475 RepID=A0A9Y2NG58_9PSEU|nr:hypothetical protein [Amycolatopsis sp. 4-36]WIY04456.1 hypothetical protein QRX60_11635 [Amycolatopsis sp. 4-36]
MDGPGVVRGCVVAEGAPVPHGDVVARRPLVADRAVVADGPAVAWGCVLAGRPAGRAVFAGRSPGRRIIACGPPGRSIVPRGPGCVVAGRPAGWAVFAGRSLVTDRSVVGGRHLARVAVAGRLAAAALRGRRRLLGWRLAADRLRRARGPVTPLRGRSAFAPRTTRTLGW